MPFADLQAGPPSVNGAALTDILLVGGIISAATVGVLLLVIVYRAGGLAPLRRFERVVERVAHIPGWAAIPGLAAIGAAVVTFMGAIWDIGVHIDDGRDDGPFGTTAHYPFLVGLVAVYLSGILAVGMASARGAAAPAGRGAVRLPGLGPVPVGALLILAGGGYAMLGFPLDDFWHRLFGQDVTLWGPTHTMFFGGLICAASGAVILMAQAARASGREPFGDWAPWRKPLAGVLGGIFLFVGVHACDEFNWAVPQYRQVWQPLLLAAFGAFALITTRALGGRGATLGALAAYLPLQLVEVELIGLLETTQPATTLFVAEALIVEAVLWRSRRAPSIGLGALAGFAVGTLGFGAEYGWTQVDGPLPWGPALLAEGLPTAALAGTAGGLLAVLMAQALTGSLASGRQPLALALAAGALIVGLGVNAGLADRPGDVRATLGLTNIRVAQTPGGARTEVADLTVALSRPDLAVNANWAYVLGWQGGGRFAADLVRLDDGTLRSSRPVPIRGTWKAFVRIHKGRTQLAVPIRMPADEALGFEGFPARPQVTRTMQGDTELMQIERKDDGPTWAWTPAMLIVMAMNLGLLALVGAGAVRSGSEPVAPRRPRRPRPPVAPVVRETERVA